MDSADRKQLEDEAVMICRHRRLMNFGISDVDEAYIRGLSDIMLEYLVERDRQLREIGYA